MAEENEQQRLTFWFVLPLRRRAELDGLGEHGCN
jgi:hypothetical protein